MAKKKKKNKNQGPVNIYQPKPEFPGLRSHRDSKFMQQMMRQSPAYKKQQQTKAGQRDAIFRQIGSYSAGAVQDAARRAGINANATKLSEGQRILQQLQTPTFSAPSRSAPSKAPARPAPAPRPAATVTPSAPESSSIGPNYNLQIQGLNDQIASLTAGFQSQAQAMQQQLAQEKAAAAEQMAQMQSNFDRQMVEQQGNFRQQMAATVGTPKVEGIRFQDAGTGGATQRQLARRGVTGTFGRGGERLLKISSLNV